MKGLAYIVLILLGIYGFWELKYPSDSFRYKLTLVVDDNGKVITASSVRQVTVRNGPKFTPESNPDVNLKGEAMVVDLGEKGVLFVVLRSESDIDYGYRIAFETFPELGGTGNGISKYGEFKAKRELGFDKLPMLVWFRDINDPKTVGWVDPNDLEKTFGKGVKLVSATIEMTDERVTTGIEKGLTWLQAWRKGGGTISGKFYSDNPSPEELLILSDFIRE